MSLVEDARNVEKSVAQTVGKITEESRPVTKEISLLGLNLEELYSAARYLEQRVAPILTPMPESKPDQPDISGGSDHAVSLQRSNQIIQAITNYIHDIAARIEV